MEGKGKKEEGGKKILKQPPDSGAFPPIPFPSIVTGGKKEKISGGRKGKGKKAENVSSKTAGPRCQALSLLSMRVKSFLVGWEVSFGRRERRTGPTPDFKQLSIPLIGSFVGQYGRDKEKGSGEEKKRGGCLQT